MFGSVTEQSDLDDWPTVSLNSIGARQVTAEEFGHLVAHGITHGSAYTVETAPGGTVAARVVAKTHTPRSNECRNVVAHYLDNSTFTWAPEHLVLLNEPCYIAAGSGVVFLADGRAVNETLFPTQSSSVEFRVGGGLTAQNLIAKMNTARALGEGVWAPLLSRGSGIYGHALAESMVQDAALHRAGLSRFISYVATSWPSHAQKIVLAGAHSPVARSRSELVKVPRVIFASKLYRHPPVGNELLHCINSIRTSVHASFGANEPRRDKVYLSRLDAPNRRMTDEAELIERLSKLGFCIIECERLSFAEQVHAVQSARLIVGPYGSQLTNAAFAAPDAILCELRSLNNPDNSPNLDDFYMALTAAMQISYAVRVVETPPGADSWECNLTETLDFIAGLSASLEHAPTAADAPAEDANAMHIRHADPPPERAPFWAIPDHTGEDFYSLLGRLHTLLRPGNYLEIGTGDGSTLALANCAAIGIDAGIATIRDIMGAKPACFLFRMESTLFFDTYDTKALLGGPVAMALLVDRHFFEDVLHDFVQLEKRMTSRSVILVHNCLPTDAHVARRLPDDQTLAHTSRHPDWWTGDVWKALAALKRFRPDLRIRAFNSYPTGLAAITNLNSQSNIIAQYHDEIIAEYKSLDLAEYGIDQYLQELDVRDAGSLADMPFFDIETE